MKESKIIEIADNTYNILGKIQTHHLERLAVVYIRQSSLYQVINNTESTQLQYNLKYKAQNLGWSSQRVLIIDQDLGHSAATVEGRTGFQRLVAEVGLNHVGIIFGIEMSRLARSCKDWHQLLEICAMFGTLIADLDGIYDPSNYNDRLLLGLKGTMSEAELHLLKQRLYQGKLNKAKRGELRSNLPIGYIRKANGEVSLDPDEQVQSVVRLIFDKFAQYKTLNAVLQYLSANNVEIGIRSKRGLEKGELIWKQPNRLTLSDLLKHPIYAGAYSFGRRQVDAKKKKPGRANTGKVVMKQEKWLVLIKDLFPAYISWQQYMDNQKQLELNQSKAKNLRAIGERTSLLAGLVICSHCQKKMIVRYSSSGRLSYVCNKLYTDYGKKLCQSLSGRNLEEFLLEQVLKVLEPASLELSLQAAQKLEKEHRELEKIFLQRLERANYEASRAARHYKLVEPENRLVARQLEKEWEEKLTKCKEVEEEFARFKVSSREILTEEEKKEIKNLSKCIDKIWYAETTTNLERKTIVNLLVKKVEVEVIEETEKVNVVIYWAGGCKSQKIIIKSVASLKQMSQYNELKQRLQELFTQKLSSRKIAEKLNEEGYKLPKRSQSFNAAIVRKLLVKLEITTRHRGQVYCQKKLKRNEWWLPQLAKELDMPEVTLFNWIYKGKLKARQLDDYQGRWIIWADKDELQRLREIRSLPKGHWSRKYYFSHNNKE